MEDNSTYPVPQESARRERAAEAARAAARAQGHADGSTRPMSGLIQWLAKRMGVRADVLAARISDENLRRSKYPYAAQENEDGTTSFKDVRVVPGKYRITAPVTPGSKRDQHRPGIEVK